MFHKKHFPTQSDCEHYVTEIKYWGYLECVNESEAKMKTQDTSVRLYIFYSSISHVGWREEENESKHFFHSK